MAEPIPDTIGEVMAEWARKLFEAAQRENDPEKRDALSADARHWAEKAERRGVYNWPPILGKKITE